MQTRTRITLILGRDALGHVILARQGDDALAVLGRSHCPINRSRPLRRRWLREIDYARQAGHDVRAIDLTLRPGRPRP